MWMIRHKWLIVVVLAVIWAVGCSFSIGQPRLGEYRYTHQEQYVGPPVRTIPIWIDKNFGAADQLAIDDAVHAWNYALNGYIVLKVVDTSFDMEIPKIVEQTLDNGWLFMKIDHTNPMIPSNEKGYWTIGFTERVGGNHLYLVRDRIGNDAVFGVTMHEIGHLLGSPHVGDHLMYPHFGRARFQCVDYDTMRMVASYNQLPADRLNYCVDAERSVTTDKDKKDVTDVSPVNCPLN